MLKKITFLVLSIPLILLVLHTIMRLVRHFYKFPIPHFLTNLIDNPLRHKIQPPDETAIRHGILPGMTVLEVGPGNGTYTLAAARQVGERGKIITIDIEPRIIDRLRRRIQTEGITIIEARIADVYDLPFEEQSFDLIFMIAVISEIPDTHRALREFHRVLKHSGRLVFSEILFDPDYSRASVLTRKVTPTGFKLKDIIGNFFYYTLIFEVDTTKESYG
jgi:ubiquinone/menaquinone biosynthesis C-methylase UbiE